ncbi:MAG: hypothetical protein ACI9MR_002291 [Myxococcota bacterium]|jgi:hypothetical protein
MSPQPPTTAPDATAKLYEGRPVSADPPVGSRRPNTAVAVVLGIFMLTALVSIALKVL